MQMSDIQKTQEMNFLFIKRLHLHQHLVKTNLLAMEGYLNLTNKLLFETAQIHDISKLAEPERHAYLWITWQYHCKKNNIEFQIPNTLQQQIRDGWLHHIQHNRHHPEAHTDHNQMNELDIVEMVCDWTAIAQENAGNKSSCKEWAINHIDNKWHFSKSTKSLIFATILELDQRRGIV